MDHRLKYKAETIKHLEENIDSTLMDLGLRGDFMNLTL